MSKDPLFQRRWEDGIPHHPKSLELMRHMQKVDQEEGCPFDLSTGGDGDNGETLMYLMDSFFEQQEQDPEAILFQPDIRHLTSGVAYTPSVQELHDEPMLFSADWQFALDNGGPLTRMILDAIKQDPESMYKILNSKYNLVIDTRVHMLMKGMLPAIGGWHGDDVQRSEKYSQPNIIDHDQDIRHWVCLLCSAPEGVSETEYCLDPVKVPVDQERVWGSVNEHLEGLGNNLNTYRQEYGVVTEFDQRTLHRATPCHNPGWRMFFRLSLTYREPQNQIRRQVQVYLPNVEGW